MGSGVIEECSNSPRHPAQMLRNVLDHPVPSFPFVAAATAWNSTIIGGPIGAPARHNCPFMSRTQLDVTQFQYIKLDHALSTSCGHAISRRTSRDDRTERPIRRRSDCDRGFSAEPYARRTQGGIVQSQLRFCWAQALEDLSKLKRRACVGHRQDLASKPRANLFNRQRISAPANHRCEPIIV